MQALQQLKILHQIILQIPCINAEINTADSKLLLQNFGKRFLTIANGCNDKQLLTFVSSVTKHCNHVAEKAKKAESHLRSYTDIIDASSDEEKPNDVDKLHVTLKKQLFFACQLDILSIFSGTPVMIEKWENTLLNDIFIKPKLKKLLEIIMEPSFFQKKENNETQEEKRAEGTVAEISIETESKRNEQAESEEFKETSRQSLLDEFASKFTELTCQQLSLEKLQSLIASVEEHCKDVVEVAKKAIHLLKNYSSLVEISSHEKQLILAYQDDILCVFRAKKTPEMMEQWGHTVLRDDIIRTQLKEILNILLKLSMLQNNINHLACGENKTENDARQIADEEALRNEFREKFKVVAHCTNEELQKFADQIRAHYENIIARNDSSDISAERSTPVARDLKSTLNALRKIIALKREIDSYLPKSNDVLIGSDNAAKIRKRFKKILTQEDSIPRLKAYVTVIAMLSKVGKLQLKNNKKEKKKMKIKPKLELKKATTARILSSIEQEPFDVKIARICDQSRELIRDLKRVGCFEQKAISEVKTELSEAYDKAIASKTISSMKACYLKQFSDKLELLAKKGSELVEMMKEFTKTNEIDLVKKELHFAYEQAKVNESVKLINEFIEKYRKIYNEQQLKMLKQQALQIISNMKLCKHPCEDIEAVKEKLQTAYNKACTTYSTEEMEKLIQEYNRDLDKNSIDSVNTKLMR
ncbi:MAG: hypothetical protein ABI597_04335 [Gammaproteobacteria bacterium]